MKSEEKHRQPGPGNYPELPFLDYQRGDGEGERNLGTAMRLAEDVYAVLFCGIIKQEYVQAADFESQKGNSDSDSQKVKFRTHSTLAKKPQLQRRYDDRQRVDV